jgi:hypothetical protein
MIQRRPVRRYADGRRFSQAETRRRILEWCAQNSSPALLTDPSLRTMMLAHPDHEPASNEQPDRPALHPPHD